MDLSKFNSQNHLYKITESTCSSLYKILTILEDNDILYTIDDSYEAVSYTHLTLPTT